jgi:enoyl-CoA hydratase
MTNTAEPQTDTSQSGDAAVLIERVGDVAVIRLNRPEARNAVNVALAQGIVDAIATCADAKAIVLTGNGSAFCAGLDLRNLGTDKLRDLPLFLNAVRDSKVPVIAAVNGAAVTGGFELALAADFMIGSPRARFADTHLRVRVYPGPVLVDLPRRVGIARAKEMTMTGNFVDAETALRIGLINHLVSEEELLPTALALATAIGEQVPEMVAHVRQDWEATTYLPFREAHHSHSRFAAENGYGGATSETLVANMDAVVSRAKTQAGS